jgi:uncharacterized tellurite resistance protein B-like protein
MKTIQLSPVARTYYGFDRVRRESILNYGYTLLTIAGGDEVISEEEWTWFEAYFINLLQLPEDCRKKLRAFDLENAEIPEYLASIKFDSIYSTASLLLYDSIRMASADENYAEDERDVVAFAGDMLGVDPEMVLRIEELVCAENAIIDLRKSILNIHPIEKQSTEHKESIVFNPWVRLNFGVVFADYKALYTFGILLIKVAQADAELSKDEMVWLIELSICAGIPKKLVREIILTDKKPLQCSDLVDQLKRNNQQNLIRVVLYLSIQLCSTDNIYTQEEKAMVQRIAHLLSIDPLTLQLIEDLVMMENAQKAIRNSLMKIQH